MNDKIRKLVSISSAPITVNPPCFNDKVVEIMGEFSNDLYDLLSRKNGFYSFESALHVFPALSESNDNFIDLLSSISIPCLPCQQLQKPDGILSGWSS
jgi:hypothetical protein